MAEDYTRNEAVAGLMIVVCLAGVLLLLLSVMNWRTWFQGYVAYEAVFDDILGVEVGTVVKTRGIQVGTVAATRRETRVGAQGRQHEVVIVTIRVSRSTRLHEGATASIVAPSLLKDPVLALDPGDKNGPMLEPGATIRGAPMAGFAELFTKSSALLDSVQQVLGEDNRGRVSRILTEIENITLEAGRLVEGLSDTVNRVSANQLEPMMADLAQFAGDLRAIGPKAGRAADEVGLILADVHGTVREVSGALVRLAGGLDGAAAELRAVLTDADGFIAAASPEVVATLVTAQREIERLVDQAAAVRGELEPLLANVDGLLERNAGDIDRIIDNLEETSRHAEQLARTLKRSPWKLVWRSTERRLAPPPEPEWVVREPTAAVEGAPFRQ